MKKLIKYIAVIALTAISFQSAIAQSATPRYYGVDPFGNQVRDNTGRILTWSWHPKTDVAGNDTLKINPYAYSTNIRATLAADSLAINVTSITRSFAGDQMQIVASGASGTKITFKGSNFQTAGTATLSSGGYAVINLVFSGTKWVEYSRVVQ